MLPTRSQVAPHKARLSPDEVLRQRYGRYGIIRTRAGPRALVTASDRRFQMTGPQAKANLTGPKRLMGLGRVELPTSRLSGVRSNHLSYRPHFAQPPAYSHSLFGPFLGRKSSSSVSSNSS